MSTSADATSEALAGSLRTRVGPFEHETRRAYSREPIPSRDLRFNASARWRLASERRRRIIRVKRRLARGRFFHPSHDGEGLPAEEEGGHGARYRPRTSRELEPRASRPRSYRLWSLASRARRGVARRDSNDARSVVSAASERRPRERQRQDRGQTGEERDADAGSPRDGPAAARLGVRAEPRGRGRPARRHLRQLEQCRLPGALAGWRAFASEETTQQLNIRSRRAARPRPRWRRSSPPAASSTR